MAAVYSFYRDVEIHLYTRFYNHIVTHTFVDIKPLCISIYAHFLWIPKQLFIEIIEKKLEVEYACL